ncbi:MAG: hypothetical protein IJ111_02560 [Eggerthellaceae bacterium]|nr:hypothetical protein [Eggerthellaceae bacterium]
MGVVEKKLLRRFRLANFLDNLLSRGFASLAWALFIAALVIVLISAFAYFLFCNETGMTVGEAFYSAFAYTINPELPEFSDASMGHGRMAITVVVVIIGLLVTSALVGIITTALTTFYEGLQRGFSPVLETGHIVIVGFNENVQTIIRELRLGHEGDRGQCFVVLDDKMTREEMERRLSGFVGASLSKFEKRTGCRIVCRNAELRQVDDLRRCAVERAHSVIINDYDDALILKTLLAVASLMREEKVANPDFVLPTTVCTFRESQFARAAEHAAEASSLRILSLSDTLSNLIAKTCYQPGLSSVLSEIYSYEGSELYIRPADDCVGMRFDELAGRFHEAVPLGICRAAGSSATNGALDVIMNIPSDVSAAAYDEAMTIREGDELVMLSHDGRDMDLLPPADGDVVFPEFEFDQNRELREASNQILVVGYDETFDQTIVNLARYYSAVRPAGEPINCTIKLLYRIKREPRVMAARQRFLSQGIEDIPVRELETTHGSNSKGNANTDIEILSTRVEFQCAMSDVIDLPVLEGVFFSGERFSHVIVLSDLKMNQEDADTETLLTLLYLKAIAENARSGDYGESHLAPFRITSEIQNMDNVDLAYNEYVSDYIISWKFIAALQVQIAESGHRYRILQDLLRPGGADIQLESADLYLPCEHLDGQTPVDFDRLARHLRSPLDPKEKRVLLGYVDMATGTHHLCPMRGADGKKIVRLGPADMLIIIKAC